MTTTTSPAPATANPFRCLLWTVPGAVAGALVVYAVSQLGDVDLVVGSGDDARTVGWVSVAVMSALAAAAGTVLLVLLERWLSRGRVVWTAIATLALLLSLGGPLGAEGTEAVIVLAAMHVVVWAALVGSAWRRRRTLR